MKKRVIIITICIIGLFVLITGINFYRASKIMKLYENILKEKEYNTNFIKIEGAGKNNISIANNQCKEFYLDDNISDYSIEANVRFNGIPLIGLTKGIIYIKKDKYCFTDEYQNGPGFKDIEVKLYIRKEKGNWVIYDIEEPNY